MLVKNIFVGTKGIDLKIEMRARTRKPESFSSAKIKKTGDTAGPASLTKILEVRSRRGW